MQIEFMARSCALIVCTSVQVVCVARGGLMNAVASASAQSPAPKARSIMRASRSMSRVRLNAAGWRFRNGVSVPLPPKSNSIGNGWFLGFFKVLVLISHCF